MAIRRQRDTRDALVFVGGETLEPSWKRDFIVEYFRHRHAGNAARMVGKSESAVHSHRKKDPNFDRCCEAIRGAIRGSLEQSALSRAIDGWEEPVYHQGEEVGTRRRYSEKLTVFMLKAHIPEKYSDRVLGATATEDPTAVAQAIIQARKEMESTIPGMQPESEIDKIEAQEAAEAAEDDQVIDPNLETEEQLE